MKKKCFSTTLIFMLCVCLTLSVAATGVLQAEASDTISSQKVTPLPEADRPEIALLDSLDKAAFVGTYWDKEDTLHIIPISGREGEIISAVSGNTQKFSNSNMPKIVVDDVKAQARDAMSAYSMAEREAAKAYLLENRDKLNIDAVGFTTDKLAVYMSDESEAAKQAVTDASPVKAIEFFGAFSPTMDDSEIDMDGSGIEPMATATTMRGGNWARTTSTSNWSTITISAVRNWNGTSGDIGFFTCGHGWTDGQSVYASDGSYVGVADVHVYDDMDVTFVHLSNTALNSHGYMNDSKRVTSRSDIYSYDSGKAVRKYGARNGNQNGEVTVTSVSGEWHDCWYDNLFVTSCYTRKGDSGGAFTINDNTIVGLMVGARSTSPQVGGTTADPIYGESVALRIVDVVSMTDMYPAT